MSVYAWAALAVFVLVLWSLWRWSVRERVRDAYRGGHDDRVTFEVQVAQGAPNPRALMRRVVAELHDEASSSDSKRRRGLGRVDFIEHLAMPDGCDVAELRLYIQCDEAVADAVKREVKQHLLGYASTFSVPKARDPFALVSEQLRGEPLQQGGAWGGLHRARRAVAKRLTARVPRSSTPDPEDA